VDEGLAMWERHLDRIVDMHNGFTDNGRFEQILTGSPIQVPSAPLIGFIRGSFYILFMVLSGFMFDYTLSV
jgi:hypothetical protein